MLRAIPLCTLALLLAAPAALGTGSSISLSFAIPDDGWFALRFNLTGPSDLDVDGVFTTCSYGEPRGAQATYVLRDRAVYSRGFAPRVRWNADSQNNGFVQVASARVDLPGAPIGGGGGNCAPWPVFHTTRPTASISTLTLVGISAGTHGWANVNFTWTQGLLSHDVAIGEGIFKTSDEFGTGAGAGIYPKAAAAGVAQRLTLQTERDSIGWFVPHSTAGAIAIMSKCTKNGAPCPEPEFDHTTQLVANASASWEFETSYVEAAPPVMTLGMITFPDNSYLD